MGAARMRSLGLASVVVLAIAGTALAGVRQLHGTLKHDEIGQKGRVVLKVVNHKGVPKRIKNVNFENVDTSCESKIPIPSFDSAIGSAGGPVEKVGRRYKFNFRETQPAEGDGTAKIHVKGSVTNGGSKVVGELKYSTESGPENPTPVDCEAEAEFTAK